MNQRLEELKREVNGEGAKGKHRNAEKMDLLWNLDSLIMKTPKAEVEKLQQEFIKTLLSCLMQDPGLPIVRSICNSIVVLLDYDPSLKTGQNITKMLHTNLTNKSTTVNARIASLRCIGRISLAKPMQVGSLLSETVLIISKQLKYNEHHIRSVAVQTLGECIEGAGVSGDWVHEEAIKILRISAMDKSPEVRIESFRTISRLISFISFTHLDGTSGTLSLCLKGLEDSLSLVRNVAATCLGNQLAWVVSATISSPTPTKTKKKQPASVQWTLEMATSYFANIFGKSGIKKELRSSLAQAYVVFLQALKPKFVESNMEMIINCVLQLLQNMNAKASSDEMVHSRMCVSYILRYGLGEHLDESGQQTMVKILAASFKKNIDHDHIVIALLRELSYLLVVLGEGGALVRETLTENILPTLLIHNSTIIRLTAAICYRCLAAAIPGYLSRTVSDCITKLTLEHAAFTTAKSDKLKDHLVALQGNAHGLGALIAALPSSKLGIPNTITNFAFQTASALLKEESSNAAVTVTIGEAGWTIIGALMTLGPPFVEANLPQLFDLWNPALSSDIIPKSEKELVIFAQIRAEALISCAAFISHCPTLLTPKVVKQIVTLLSNLFNMVTSIPEGNYQPSTVNILTLLKANLLKAFSALPCTSYAHCHNSILKLIVVLIAEGNGVSLKGILDEKDNLLGPWNQVAQGEEATEEQLLENPVALAQDFSLVWNSSLDEALSPVALTNTIVFLSSRLLARIFVSQPEKNRQQLLEYFVNAIKNTNPPARKIPIINNYFYTLLRILRKLIKKKITFNQGTLVMEFVKGYLGDIAIDIRRAAGESLGMLARIEGDKFATELVKAIIAHMKKTKDVNLITGCSFALGCIKRSMGGMRSGAHLKDIMGVLFDLIKDKDSLLQTWGLHSLYLCIEAAGPGFAGLVKDTMNTIYTEMINLENPSTAEYQCLGRVVHAIIHALGPELEATSIIMQRSSCLSAEMRAYDHPLVQLETIHFEQSLILFAPQIVDIDRVVTFLKTHFTSPYLLLRHAAIICLRQVVQIDAPKVDKLEQDLFIMLDSERDGSLRRELRLLLSTLLDALAPSSPSHWVQVCSQMVMSSARTKRSVAAPIMKREDEINNQDVDNDTGILQSVQTHQSEQQQEDTFVPRWRTKLFSMECVRRIMGLMSNSPAHFDLSIARNENEKKGMMPLDFLVFNVGDLVRMAFSVATSDIEALRPVGIQAIKDIVQYFGASLDPDYSGHLLLEQYQAQIKSALTPAFEPTAPPDATAAAATALVPYITSNIIQDEKGISRILNLLTAPIENLYDLHYEAYNEKATTMIQLAILHALAQLRNKSVTEGGLRFAHLLKPYFNKLQIYWTDIMRDYAVLSTQTKATLRTYKAAFFTFSTLSDVKEYFEQAWTDILLALTSLIASQDSPNNNDGKMDDIERLYILLGICMNQLCGPLDSPKVLICLQATRNLLQPKYLNTKYFSQELCKELSQVLTILIEAGEARIKLESLKLICHIITHLDRNYFSQDWENLLVNMQEAIVGSIHYYIPNIFSTQSSPPRDIDNVGLEVVGISISCLGRFLALLSDEARVSYGPSIIYILVKICDLSCTHESFLSLLSRVNETMQMIIQIFLGQWETIVHSTVHSIIHILQSPEKEPISLNWKPLISLLYTIIITLSETGGPTHLHTSSIAILKKALTQRDTACQQVVLSGLRNFLSTAKVQSIALKYLQALGPEILAILIQHSKKIKLSDEEITVSNEVIRILVLSETLAQQQDNQATILPVLIPSLIGLLQPDINPPTKLHELSLQILMKLATTSPQFKIHVGSLSEHEKQQLEKSLKLSAAQQSQQQTNIKKDVIETKVQPLKLDFSKYT